MHRAHIKQSLHAHEENGSIGSIRPHVPLALDSRSSNSNRSNYDNFNISLLLLVIADVNWCTMAVNMIGHTIVFEYGRLTNSLLNFLLFTVVRAALTTDIYSIDTFACHNIILGMPCSSCRCLAAPHGRAIPCKHEHVSSYMRGWQNRFELR